DMKLVAGLTPEAGPHLLSNGDFESGVISPWNVTANMTSSSVSTTIKHSGARSLRVVAAAAGSTQTDSIWQSVAVTVGAPYTLSNWYLPVTNYPSAVIRPSGSWIDTSPAACGDGVL